MEDFQKNFSNFQDNVKSLKFLNDKGEIVKINKEKTYKLIGFGLYGVILSAELYINKTGVIILGRQKKL